MACKLVHHKFITCSVFTALQILVLQPTKVEPEVSLWESSLAFCFMIMGITTWKLSQLWGLLRDKCKILILPGDNPYQTGLWWTWKRYFTAWDVNKCNKLYWKYKIISLMIVVQDGYMVILFSEGLGFKCAMQHVLLKSAQFLSIFLLLFIYFEQNSTPLTVYFNCRN